MIVGCRFKAGYMAQDVASVKKSGKWVREESNVYK